MNTADQLLKRYAKIRLAQWKPMNPSTRPRVIRVKQWKVVAFPVWIEKGRI